MNFDKNFFWGLGLGVLAGAVGYKLYNDNKQTLLNSLESLKTKLSADGAAQTAQAPAELADSEGETTEIDLAELEKQKEHLEDLIAEQQSKAAEADKS
ncbi:MAG: hypothetical protein IJ523_03455 [Succinivibrionaceae bacterium]|nr:hypothetical protein [Succinivibrionaceae bacterium]